MSLAARCKLLGLTILDLPRAEQANGAAERVLNVASLRHPDDVVFQLYFVAIALGMSVRSYLTRLIFCLVYHQRDLTCSILLFETGINKQRRKSRRGDHRFAHP